MSIFSNVTGVKRFIYKVTFYNILPVRVKIANISKRHATGMFWVNHGDFIDSVEKYLMDENVSKKPKSASIIR